MTEISSETAELIKFLRETAEMGLDFAIDKAPIVAQQIIYWRIIQSAMFCIIGLAGFAAITYFKRKYAREHPTKSLWNEAGPFPILAQCLAIVVFLGSISAGLQAYFAPTLVILEYLR
jgi:TRAP-type C4-dicarboxylate transport system permease small subunit